MDVNKREETLEEMSLDSKEDIVNKIEPDKMIDDVLNDASPNSPAASSNNKAIQPSSAESNMSNPSASDGSSNTNNLENSNNASETESSSEDEEYEYSSMSSGKKKLIITILSILLVIDVAALVIYFIGIDKVLGFIK